MDSFFETGDRKNIPTSLTQLTTTKTIKTGGKSDNAFDCRENS